MSICDIPGISTVCTTIGEGPAGLFFGWIASAMGLAVSTLFQGMWEVFSTTTSVDVTSDGYVKVYNILFGVAVLVRHHVMQAHRACFKMPADPRNPYVYAHTGTDVEHRRGGHTPP